MEENKNKNCQHYKTTFCWKYFHKRHRDLTPEEKFFIKNYQFLTMLSNKK